MAPKAAVPRASEQAVPGDIFQLTHSFLSGVAVFEPRGISEDQTCVKRRLGHKDPLSLESFESMVEEGPNSDIESISGSESEDEAERSGAKIDASREGPTTSSTDAKKPSMTPSEGGSGGIKSPTELGEKNPSTSDPKEVTRYRKMTRADFPRRWPRNLPFEDEAEYDKYVAKFIGVEFPMTDKKNEEARKVGFRDRVHELAMRLLDER
ncbi:hypothetical protein KFL_001990080 [Klebsormidium nitens]|uniref:Uncharacterized protein n=1 Tax=Klebsormidium nitens TaxID=105231 RepID=A0A1Y1I169_KLENI|nr:hypothetical protein KFL_001990080 [Klebsormidium nitens]|eukprot:GAQ84655.1 hypothetical protein KFL_001990080 [Klebsormidium nitens]